VRIDDLPADEWICEQHPDQPWRRPNLHEPEGVFWRDQPPYGGWYEASSWALLARVHGPCGMRRIRQALNRYGVGTRLPKNRARRIPARILLMTFSRLWSGILFRCVYHLHVVYSGTAFLSSDPSCGASAH
jgi:hypothetical protein